MIGNTQTNPEDATDQNLELSIGKACEEYNESVKLTLVNINHQLDEVLSKNNNELDELGVKIAARANFLENNPSFLSYLVYDKETIKIDPLLEFDEIKLTLNEHSRRIQETLEEIEKHHRQIFDLVKSYGSGDEDKCNATKEEDDFQDCVEVKSEPEAKETYHEIQKEESRKTYPEIRKEESRKTYHEIRKEEKTQLTFDKVTIESNAFCDLTPKSSPITTPVKYQIFPDITPDVQRRRPQEDLHGKLMQQVVATDSLEGFLKLMDRKPIEKRKDLKKNLQDKYIGSLYFFPKELKKKPSKAAICKPKKIPEHKSSQASTCCSLLVTSSQPCPTSNQDRTRKIRQGLHRHKLKCYDLLDDIDRNDLKPIKSEYPRRDNVDPPIKLKDAKSYLHRMMEENDKVWKKLLQPIEVKKVKKQSLVEKKKQARAKQAKNLMEYLTAPEQKILSHIPQSLIVMPVKIIYDNFPTKEKTESPRGCVLITDLTKAGEPKRIEGKFLKNVSSVPMQKKKEMLDQIRGLKMRNDNIQKNIHKAIDVIETKMVDLLSTPTEASNADAFNAMEKEITTVLQMMNENEQKKEEMKMEPEKEAKPTPKLKQKTTILKRFDDVTEAKKTEDKVKKPVEQKINTKKFEVESEVQKNEDKVKKPVEQKMNTKKSEIDAEAKKEDAVKKPVEQKTNTKKSEVEAEAKKHEDKVKKPVEPKIKDGSKVEKTKTKEEKKVSSPKNQGEAKKAADIEEGERLLHQVDDVIKKIDNIYTKFYDDGKTKRKDVVFSSVADFFDGLKTEKPLVLYDNSYQIGQDYETATVFSQVEVFYTSEIITPDVCTSEISGDLSTSETSPESSAEDFFKTTDEIVSVIQVQPKEIIGVPDEKIMEPLEVSWDKARHDSTLKSFYTLFFTSVFMALNLNYSS